MKILRLPMGCLSSRSTVSPTGRVELTGLKAIVVNGNEQQQQQQTNSRANAPAMVATTATGEPTTTGGVAGGGGAKKTIKDNNTAVQKDAIKIPANESSSPPLPPTAVSSQKAASKNGNLEWQSTNSSVGSPEDDIMSILINNRENYSENIGTKNLPNNITDSKNVNSGSSDGAGGGNGEIKGKPGDKVKSHDIRGSGTRTTTVAMKGTGDREMPAKGGGSVGDQTAGTRPSVSDNSYLAENSDIEKVGESGGEQEEIERRSTTDESDKKVEGNFDNEENLELLRQYIAIDYGITQLEDKDTLRVYHEKIEQLEQLERELDMISSEAEEVAGRSELGTPVERSQSISMHGSGKTNNEQKMDMESNSLASGATGSMSHKSWTTVSRQPNQQQQQQVDPSQSNQSLNRPNSRQTTVAQSTASRKGAGKTPDATGRRRLNHSNNESTTTNHNSNRQHRHGSNNNNIDNDNNLSYLTVGEVFNRKIILEKERDKLKKEVEIVIVECDRLQQLYKRRDEILDKLFDGRTGNGLENHLEQQLNWLLEQKHYVDQVFYAWKRAETLTSQTCEQFASASDLLKRLPKVEDAQQRADLAKSISQLLVKSRKDMEQAQKYNPNVDAPFFTENETERFDKIIETISSNSINSTDYSQILTVIQFAYKRAVSIRLWLEQILQTTIARDSFELAEEYKWIAIQLRKERINLIKSKLQNAPYQMMVQSIQEQLARQQSLVDRRQQHEINRDSGVESETNDIDIEEEIYRLLELNKSRLEALPQQQQQQQQQQPQQQQQQQAAPSSANQQYSSSAQIAGGGEQQLADLQQQQQEMQQIRATQQKADPMSAQQQLPAFGSRQSDSANNRDEIMKYRIERRLTGEQPLHLSQVPTGAAQVAPPEELRKSSAAMQQRPVARVPNETASSANSNSLASAQTPTKLRIELDEEARQNLLKQVDQVHNRHRSRIERLRGKNRAKLAIAGSATAELAEASALAETEAAKTAADASSGLKATTRPPHPTGSDAATTDNSDGTAITGSN